MRSRLKPCLSMSAVRSPWLASLALLLVTLCWGSTFPAMKAVSEQMPPGLMVALRWLLGALALAPFIEWRNRSLWRDASLLALALFASFVLQVLGLTMMSAGRNAFITALNVIMVPLLLPLLGRRLSPLIWVAVVLAGAGIVVMGYGAGGNLLGGLLTFGVRPTRPDALDQGAVDHRERTDLAAVGHVREVEHNARCFAFHCEHFWTIGAVELQDHPLRTRCNGAETQRPEFRSDLCRGQTADEEQGE